MKQRRYSTWITAQGLSATLRLRTANGAAVLKWKAVPLAESFAVLYTADGSEPAEGNGSSVDVPETCTADAEGIYSFGINGLTNGDLYRFRISADCSDGCKNLSGAESVIPMSPYYLCPTVKTGYRKVSLNWLALEGAYSYRVYRSTKADGHYQDVSGLVSGTGYTDKNLAAGQTYFYRVAPSIDGSIMSAPASAVPNNQKELPCIAGSAAASGSLVRMSLDGSLACCVDLTAGLAVYDIGSASAPRLTGTRAEDGIYYEQSRVYVHDGYIYISGSDESADAVPNRLFIYNGSSLSEPIQNLEMDYIYNFIADGNVLYIVGRDGTYMDFKKLDISSPSEISLSEDITDYGNTGIRYTYCTFDDMIIHDGLIYVTAKENDRNIVIIDAGTPDSAGVKDYSSSIADIDKGSLSLEEKNGEIKVWTLYGDRDMGPVIYTLCEYDVSNPANIVENRTFSPLNTPMDVVVRDGYAYIADNSGKLQILSLFGDPAVAADSSVEYQIGEAMNIPVSGNIADMAYQDGRLYLACGSRGLLVIDTAGHAGVETAGGSCDLEENLSISFNGDYAYSADGISGIRVLELGKQGAVSCIHTVDPVSDDSGNGIVDVKVHGGYLFAACDDDEGTGVYIYDISNPAEPVFSAGVLSSASAVELQANYLYALSGDDMNIFNIEVPANPVPLSAVSTAGAEDIKIQGNYAFIAYASGADTGIAAIDILNPAVPRVGGSCSAGNYASNTYPLVLNGDYAYLGCDYVGGDPYGYYASLYIIDISDPGSLSDNDLIEDGDADTGEGFSFWHDGSSVTGMDSDGRYLYVSEKWSSQSLYVLDCLNPEYPVMISNTVIGTGNSYLGLNGKYIYAGCESGVVRSFNIGE